MAANRSRFEWDSLPRERLGRPSVVRPSVWRVDGPGGPLVVKDARSGRWWARPLARWLLRRERRILARLSGLDGVPQVLAEAGPDAFACSWLEGRPLDREAFQARPRAMAEALRARIDAIHARGVFHMDLRQRQNVLHDGKGGVAFVDFGAALALGAAGRRVLGRLLGAVDRQAALKYLARYAPEALTEDEARAVVRWERWRRLWPFTPHRSRGGPEAARRRLGRS